MASGNLTKPPDAAYAGTMTDIMIMSIACGTPHEAEKLAQMLVSLKLAACVQTHPIESTYVWEGAVERAHEVMLTAKTLRDKLSAIEVVVKAHHSYEVPEMIAMRPEWVSQPYVDWLRGVLG